MCGPYNAYNLSASTDCLGSSGRESSISVRCARPFTTHASVETIPYDANAGQAVLRVTLTDEANVTGYDPFTVSTEVTVVPAVPNDPSAPPVGTVVAENACECDRVVE